MPDQIHADRQAIERVFINLISNAIKYSPSHTEIQVRGWRLEDKVFVTVTDQGVGMSEADIPRLFSRFFRAETSMGTAGTGLGLCVAQELVNMHGGLISVESHVGEGSTFMLTLPLDPKKTRVEGPAP